MKFVAIGCLCVGALAGVACAAGRGVPTTPTVTLVDSSLSAAPRSGDLQATKECSHFASDAYCTIQSSTVKAIEVGSKIHYSQPSKVGTAEGSDVVLDLPGPGNNTAFGHCSLAVGKCTFSGGTGKFTTFQASVAVWFSAVDSLWHWEGTYSFGPQD